MFKFMFPIYFRLETKPQTPYHPMIGEPLIDKYYPGTCQHKIQPSIYPQQILEQCHSFRLSTIHLFQLNYSKFEEHKARSHHFFLFCILSATEKLHPL